MNKHIFSLIDNDITSDMNIVCDTDKHTRMKLYVSETIYAFVTVPYKVTKDFYNVFMKYYHWYKNPNTMVTFKTCLMCPIPETLEDFEGPKFGPYTYTVIEKDSRFIYTMKHNQCEHPCIVNVREKLPNGYADFRLLMTEHYGHMVGLSEVYYGKLRKTEWTRVQTDFELARLYPSKMIVKLVDPDGNMRIEIGREVFELDANYAVTYHGYDDFNIPIPEPAMWRRCGKYMWSYREFVIVANVHRKEIQLTSTGLVIRIGPKFVQRSYYGENLTEPARCNIYLRDDIGHCINLIKKYDIFSIV